MAQNIYDTTEFYEGYSRLPRSVHGLAGAPEWPAVRALLPELTGKRVVDLGCGFGWFCRWAAEQSAADVLGLDLSENMLARARRESASPTVTYEIADLETLSLPPVASTSPTAPSPFTTSSTSPASSRPSTMRSFPALASCSPSSTRSTWRRPAPAG